MNSYEPAMNPRPNIAHRIIILTTGNGIARICIVEVLGIARGQHAARCCKAQLLYLLDIQNPFKKIITKIDLRALGAYLNRRFCKSNITNRDILSSGEPISHI